MLFYSSYDLVINQCWMESPDRRLSFQDITVILNSLLEDVAGYVDFSAICRGNMASANDCLAPGYDHLVCNNDDNS